MNIAPPPPTSGPIDMFDIECYENYFLIKFLNLHTGHTDSFEMYEGHPLDRAGVIARIRRGVLVGFNSKNYDEPMLACALAGFTCSQLKKVSNAIIQTNLKPWDIEREFLVDTRLYLNHIDMIEIAPGQASLKLYGAKMGSKKLQDLPYPHDAILSRQEMINVDSYCGNDLLLTKDIYLKFLAQIATRIDLSAQYDTDMRSKSDAQIAEAAFKKLLNLNYQQCAAIKEKNDIRPGAQFVYTPASFIRFTTPELQQVLSLACKLPFTVQPSGKPQISDQLAACKFRIGTGAYQLTAGGLHSQESCASHRADDVCSLLDVDVESFYPKIMSICKLFPPQIGPQFLTIFDGWIETRLGFKRSGNKKKADTYKIKLNGTYGKTGERHSILYDPRIMIQVTLTGQLSLLMLIERLHLQGIDVVSANTDGIVIKCRRDRHHIRDFVVKQWELDTGFKTEGNEYKALFSRDVNAYLAFKTDGTVKAKGAFAPPEPVASSWPNPHAQICTDAVCEFILHGTPIADTVQKCTDIKLFVSARNVKGGGQWSIDKSYIGKSVRWYYGRGQTGYIEYVTNGNKVATTQGAKPCMELPDTLPNDIDYAWYVAAARQMLIEINCC